MLYKETEIYIASDYEIVKEINQGRDLLPVCFHFAIGMEEEEG